MKSDCPKNPKRVHEWNIVESRVLHGVEPPTKIHDHRCIWCNQRKTTEHPHVRPTT